MNVSSNPSTRWCAGIALLTCDTLLRFLLRGHAALPLVTAAEGESHLKTLAPIYAIGGLAGLWGFAWLERLALSDARCTAAFFVLLVAIDLIVARLPGASVVLTSSAESEANRHEAVPC